MSIATSWTQAEGMADKHESSGGIFVRLTGDGDKIVGAFCGEPFGREVIWNGERYETFDPNLHTDKKPSMRVMLNFYVPALHEMKVIEGGTVWFKDILKLREKYGLDNWLFEIERHGEAGNPKTKYTILPEAKLDAAQQDEIRRLGLHDLASLVDSDADLDKDIDDALIDEATATQLTARLKALPMTCIETFLKQFNVQRVREVRRANVKDALLLVGALEARSFQPARTDEVEIDPFA